MNKIICNVCGTSYPENATQCPICGYVQAAEKATSANSESTSYTYVKGGRFSKANVKKRNQAKQAVGNATSSKRKSSYSKKSGHSNTGTIVLIAILLLAIIVVTGYIVLRFFLPNSFLYEGLGNIKQPSVNKEYEGSISEMTNEPTTDATEETTDPAELLKCTAVNLESSSVELEGIGSTYSIVFTLEPEETLDLLTFTTSDQSVATVDERGLITAAGEGSAVITVSCGSASTECNVVVKKAEEPIQLTLNRKEITLNSEGQTWLLYDGDIPLADIVWTSDDNKVAVVVDGKVVAIGSGDTAVYGIYEDQKVQCIIHCNFEEDDTSTDGVVSEASGDGEITYSLYNPYGYADDVTLNPGEKFTLKLVDEDKNEVNAEWSVNNSNVCTISSNIVTALNSGYTTITATFEGKTYSCVVRVK